MTSWRDSLLGVGSRFTGNRCAYGPDMLIERFADADPLPPTCTTLGGVLPGRDASFASAGELFRMTLMPGALLGVSDAALLLFADLLKRGISYAWGAFGGEDGRGASASKACVSFENLIAGGGSSSESLSPISILFNAGASAEKPCIPFETESGELRRMCGREGCAIAAMTRLSLFPKPFFLPF